MLAGEKVPRHVFSALSFCGVSEQLFHGSFNSLPALHQDPYLLSGVGGGGSEAEKEFTEKFFYKGNHVEDGGALGGGKMRGEERCVYCRGY